MENTGTIFALSNIVTIFVMLYWLKSKNNEIRELYQQKKELINQMDDLCKIHEGENERAGNEIKSLRIKYDDEMALATKKHLELVELREHMAKQGKLAQKCIDDLQTDLEQKINESHENAGLVIEFQNKWSDTEADYSALTNGILGLIDPVLLDEHMYKKLSDKAPIDIVKTVVGLGIDEPENLDNACFEQAEVDPLDASITTSLPEDGHGEKEKLCPRNCGYLDINGGGGGPECKLYTTILSHKTFKIFKCDHCLNDVPF